MIKTKITEMFGCTYPFVGGAMMHISNAEFVASVSEAGGIGVMASTIYQDIEKFRDAIKTVQDRTDKPFAVNLNLFPSVNPVNNNAYMDVILEEGVKIVETSGNRPPGDIIARLKPEGITTVHKCVGVRYAKKVVSLGVDVVTVVGCENGGAIGKLDVTTMCLIPAVLNEVDVPVIGGGGVATGKGIASLLALGAEGVIMGTRMLLTKECPIHDNLKQALLAARETDTAVIMRTFGNSHRCLINDVTRKVIELEERKAPINEVLPYIIGEESQKMLFGGELTKGYISCGQGIGQIKRIIPVKELFQQFAEEVEATTKRLTGMLN